MTDSRDKDHLTVNQMWRVPEKPLNILKDDNVNMPSHYTQLPIECIDVTEHFTFCVGNALKYLWRHQHKGKPLEDLKKAAWYVQREIDRLERSK